MDESQGLPQGQQQDMMGRGGEGICNACYIYQSSSAGLPYPDGALLAKFAETLSSPSKDTKSAYLSDTRLFMNWADSAVRKEFPFANKHAVAAWVAHFAAAPRDLRNSTINRHLAGLRAFYEWLIDVNDLPFANPVVKRHYRPDKRKHLPRPIDETTLKRIFAGVKDVRDLAFYKLLNSSGCRISGVLGAAVRDVSVLKHKGAAYGAIRTVEKGNEEHVAFFNKNALNWLCKYLEKCPAEPNEMIFRSHRGGGPLTRIGAQKRFGYWIKKLGIAHIHLHQFRHSFGTRMVERGMPVEILQKLYNHKIIFTTQQYFKLSDARMFREFRKASA